MLVPIAQPALLGIACLCALAAVQASSNSDQSVTLVSGNANSDQTLAATPGARGQCDALTGPGLSLDLSGASL